jgi:opacity protein-like surface antigen
MLNKVLVTAGVLILFCSPAALAQTPAPAASTGTGGQLLIAGTSSLYDSALAANAMQPGGAGSRRTYIPRGFAGLWTSAGDGFLVGAGVSTRPFTEERHEVQGNGFYNRVEGFNGFGFDADYLYNFTRPSGSTFTPFAGAGINVTRFSFDCGDIDDLFGIDCSTTDTALQIGGGIKRPLASGREFFAELFFLLNDASPIMIRAGLGF